MEKPVLQEQKERQVYEELNQEIIDWMCEGTKPTQAPRSDNG